MDDLAPGLCCSSRLRRESSVFQCLWLGLPPCLCAPRHGACPLDADATSCREVAALCKPHTPCLLAAMFGAKHITGREAVTVIPNTIKYAEDCFLLTTSRQDNGFAGPRHSSSCSRCNPRGEDGASTSVVNLQGSQVACNGDGTRPAL